MRHGGRRGVVAGVRGALWRDCRTLTRSNSIGVRAAATASRCCAVRTSGRVAVRAHECRLGCRGRCAGCRGARDGGKLLCLLRRPSSRARDAQQMHRLRRLWSSAIYLGPGNKPGNYRPRTRAAATAHRSRRCAAPRASRPAAAARAASCSQSAPLHAPRCGCQQHSPSQSC